MNGTASGSAPGSLGFAGVRHELPALLAFRLRIGERRRRWAVPAAATVVLATTLGLPLVTSAATRTGIAAVDPVQATVVLVLPTAWSFFVVSAFVAAVGAAGGRELLPRAQAQVFPVSPATDHAGALLLTPLNLAWSLQAAGLFAAVGIVAADVPGVWVRLWVATLLWVLAATAVAQLAGWATELARTFPGGGLGIRLTGLAAVGVAAWAVISGRIGRILDSLPTVDLYLAVIAGEAFVDPGFALTLAALAGTAVAATVAAVPLVALLGRRPTGSQAHLETVPRPAMAEGGRDLALLARLDRRLVSRSTPLRRGLVVLTALPVLAAALVPLPWLGITVLPALIASATGLLFGVNAFALDGPGAVWRDSLPQRPRLWLDSRVLVLAQLSALCVAAVVVTAALRNGTPPTATQATAVAAACLVSVVQVVSRCAQWSVHRPYPAPLRGARDAPAPPVALAGYSMRLATATTLSGILFAFASAAPTPAVPAILTLPFLIAGGWTFRRAFEAFDRLEVRARVTAAVSGA
ncbi:MAG: hypothetical protein ACFCVF_03650 [Kineosporiaceae bacterium]